ncbi:MAG: VWA domain-containing protein [Turicibacter sp.]|nr:VWA domain-containing protein [Turicibacter sp.]
MKKEKKFLTSFIFMMMVFISFTFQNINVNAQILQPFISLSNRLEEKEQPIENPLNIQRLSYEDIYGKAQMIPLNTPVPLLSMLNNNYDCQVNLIGSIVDSTDQTQGFLIGDLFEIEVNFLPGDTNYDKVTSQLPATAVGSTLLILGDGKNEVILTDNNNNSHTYLLKLNKMTPNKENKIQIKFKIFLKDNNTPIDIQKYTEQFYVKKGAIQVSLEDGLDPSLLANMEVTLTDENDNPYDYTAVVENDKLVFNEVPSGEYKVKVEGDEFKVEDTIITLNYANPTASVTVHEAIKPDIEAELTELKPGTAVHDREEVTMTYTLTPKPFNAMEDKLNKVTEALFVLDVSRDMTTDRKTQIVDTIQQMIENASPLLKVGVMGYDSEIIYSTNNTKIPFYSVADETEKTNFITDLESITSHVSQEGRDLSVVLEEADKVMTTSTASNSKAVILISQDQVEFDPSIVSNLHLDDYQFITLSLSDTGVTNQTSLKDVHKQLASDETYFEIMNEDALSNAVAHVNQMLSSFIVINPTLTFDLGPNFEAVEGLTSIQDTSYEIQAPEIVYELDVDTNEYKATNVTVSFKVKVVNTSPGDSITFVDSNPPVNYLSYEQLDGMLVMKSIDVPIFTVEEAVVDIEHGLYGGVSKKKLNIISQVDEEDTNNGVKTFVEGSTVNFAATFDYQPYYTDFSLVIDPKLTVSAENIKVYQVKEENDTLSLDLIKNVDMYLASFSTGTNITLNLYNKETESGHKITSGDKILVLYSAKVPQGNNIEYKNQMIVNGTKKVVQIKGINQSLDANV